MYTRVRTRASLLGEKNEVLNRPLASEREPGIAERCVARHHGEQNELCSLPGYWHSCRVVNRAWHLPEWNQWLSERNLDAAADSSQPGDFAKLAAARPYSSQVGRCPLLNRRSRFFGFFRRDGAAPRRGTPLSAGSEIEGVWHLLHWTFDVWGIARIINGRIYRSLNHYSNNSFLIFTNIFIIRELFDATPLNAWEKDKYF